MVSPDGEGRREKAGRPVPGHEKRGHGAPTAGCDALVGGEETRLCRDDGRGAEAPQSYACLRAARPPRQKLITIVGLKVQVFTSNPMVFLTLLSFTIAVAVTW